MNTLIRGFGRLALAASLLAGAGCSQLGQAGDILGGVLGTGGMGGMGGSQNQVTGEIRGVDARGQRLEIRAQDGRSGVVYFDSRTRVIYQQREYQPSALEQGDYVTMRIQQDQQGRAYTDYIEVQQSVQDRGGTGSGGGVSGQVQRVEGNVSYVDTSRGTFQMRDRYGATLVVSLPYAASRTDVDRFRRLRNGDFVRADVRMLSEQRADLERFL
ncbi:MAG TPA: hypothetical protein VF263_19350 [Longimicrobiaceae bacterium]